jgi:hypothetical protein
VNIRIGPLDSTTPTMTPMATSYTCMSVGRSPAKAKKRPKDTLFASRQAPSGSLA